MKTFLLRQAFLLAFSTLFLSNCKALFNNPSREPYLVFSFDDTPSSNPAVATASSNPVATTASTVPAVAASSVYPAGEFYGNRWNTQYVRLNSDPRPTGVVTLDLAPRGSTGFAMPVCGNVLSEFGMRNGRMHEGIDLRLTREQPVYSAFDGMVRVARDHGSYGNVVAIRHDNGLETVYSHLNSIAVRVNQRVTAGERIGGGGRTGNATTDHLHLEIRFMGEPLNPRLIIDFENCILKSEIITLDENSYR